jgi:hypothetical protein
MQVHYYVKEDIVVDGAGDINFVTVFVVVKIDYHLMNDGLSTTMLTSRVIGGLSSISVFTTFTSTNTMNNVLPIVIFANEESCPSMIGSMPSFHNQGSYVNINTTFGHVFNNLRNCPININYVVDLISIAALKLVGIIDNS